MRYKRKNKIHLLRLFINSGADPNIQDKDGNTKKVFFVSRKINFFMNLRRLPLANCKLNITFICIRIN